MRVSYWPEIVKYAKDFELDPELVARVVLAESSARADAFRYEPQFWARYCVNDPKWAGWEPRRVASSYGLMQIMYPTALQYGFRGAPEELFQIPVNLQWGCRILAHLLLQAQGDVETALAAYNGGWGNRHGAQPRQYARKVLAQTLEPARA